MKNRIIKLMEIKNLTATKFAEIINANPSAISHILNERNKPSYDMIMNIAQAFPDINLEWLMRGNGDMFKSVNVGTESNPQMTLFEPIAPKSVLKTEPNPVKQPIQEQASPLISNQDVMNLAISKSPNRSVKRIMLFYNDGTFEEFTHV